VADVEGGLRRRAVAGGMWTLLQQAYTTLAGAIAFAVLARLIGPSDFGLAALAQVFIALTVLFSDLGVTPSLIRLPDVTDTQLSTAFWLGLGLGLGLCGVLEVGATPAAIWLHEPRLALILRVVALTIPVTQLCAVPTAILSRQLKMRPQASRQIASVTVATGGALVLAFLGAGVWALVFQDCGTVAIDATMLWRAIDWRPTFTFSRREASGLLKFGIQVTGSQIVNQGRDRVVQLIIGRLLGVRDVGYWAIASQISYVATTVFSSTINSVALPAFAMVQNDRLRLSRALRHGVRLLGAVSMPVLCGLGALSPTLIPTIFGQRWVVVAGLAAITTVTAGINTVQWLDGNVWWAVGKPRVQMYLVWIITAIHLGAVWFFARYGLTAVAWAIFGRTILSFVLRIVALIRVAKMPLSCYQDMPAIVFCTAVTYGVMRLVGGALASASGVIILAGQIAAGTVVYLGLSWFLQRETLLELWTDLSGVFGRAPRQVAQAPSGAGAGAIVLQPIPEDEPKIKTHSH
jgi:O-antigen/teichoic acid export membrane protein